MRHQVIVAAALLALSTAAPAQFTQAGPPADGVAMPSQPSVRSDRAAIRRSIREGRRSGDISRAEARSFRRDDAAIGSLADRFAADGLSLSEQAELQSRTEALRGMVNARRVRGGKP
ncbi:hypothetical protein NZL82_01885 [Sphingomonas sanguinis]|uniref:hypothetical protein n=1 Tax=Sphingomonas sp. LC-1 TaxID=3110957 RepID=UPI0021BA40BB|nr:hypothetical protein [Sphingomonas sp. LC-1]MCT8000622.1 hypothetical protein [Sphingomonas sp. LC-1]